jgi:hypothetical protein
MPFFHAHRFYKQEYCGCVHSLRDTNLFRAHAGQPPVKIGTGGVFSDPVADCEEESEQAVAAFFESASAHFQVRPF